MSGTQVKCVYTAHPASAAESWMVLQVERRERGFPNQLVKCLEMQRQAFKKQKQNRYSNEMEEGDAVGAARSLCCWLLLYKLKLRNRAAMASPRIHSSSVPSTGQTTGLPLAGKA